MSTQTMEMPLDAALELADKGSETGGIMTNLALQSLAKAAREQKTAYDDGYETAQQSCCEMLNVRERLLARWLDWARAHGHLEHAAGIADDTREILPPQLLFPNAVITDARRERAKPTLKGK